MIREFAEKSSDFFIKYNADSSMREVYAYAVECVVSTTIIVGLLLLVGVVLNSFIPMLIYTAAWIILRIFVGGIHASSHLGCTVISVMLGAAAILLSEYVNVLSTAFIIVVTVLCYLFVFFFAPIIHKNHPVSAYRRKKMRVAAKVIGVAEAIAIIVLAMLKSEIYTSLFMAYISTTILGILGYFNKNTLRQYD